ncbi:hypothetical protein ABZP36_001089 [Zizania latifolia]
MRTTDKLRNLTDLYLDMHPADRRGAVVGFFMHHGRRVRVGLTPADYDMKDGDEITFVPISKRTVFVTLKIKDDDGQVEGEKSPSDYEMEDGGEITFSPISRKSVFVTLKIKGDDGYSYTRTMRRTDRLQVLIDFFISMDPFSCKNGDFIMFVTLKIKGDDECSFIRTLRRTDGLQVLIDFYNTMVPNDKNGVFMYNGKQVDGEKSPADYMMEDGDHVILCQPVKFLTISVVGPSNFEHRNDK